LNEVTVKELRGEFESVQREADVKGRERDEAVQRAERLEKQV